MQLSRCRSTAYTLADRILESVSQLASWHSAQSVTRCIQLLVVSQLLVKLEISLTLSGEIDNSNVKRVGEVSR